MPASPLRAARFRLLPVAGLLCLLATLCSFASTRRIPSDLVRFEHAERLRESLEGRPERQRTRPEYERVLRAYRAIYHANPSSPHATASVIAVADLLAEEGRLFQDDKALHDAIGQYAFLRTNYPGSRFRFSALLTIGEIQLRDLNNPATARATFREFLRLYPENPLADEARIELHNLRASPRRRSAPLAVARRPVIASPVAQAAAPRNAVASVARPTIASGSIQKTTWNAPPSQSNHAPLVTGIRYWSTPVYTRVAIDLEREVRYEAIRVSNPDRIFFDLYGARLSPVLEGKSDQVIDDGFLHEIRASQFQHNVTRIVLNVSSISGYSAFFLPNPPRLIIDIHGTRRSAPLSARRVSPSLAKPPAHRSLTVAEAQAPLAIGLGPQMQSSTALGVPVPAPREVRATPAPTTAPIVQSVAGTTPAPQNDEEAAAEATATEVSATEHAPGSRPSRHPRASSPRASVARPAAPLSNSAGTSARIHSPAQPVRVASSSPSVNPLATTRPQAPLVVAPQPTADGEPTMVRALGLKINRIVIDAGHGGHDSGTIGPDGLEEKNVALDVALRLGKLLKQRLGADVIFTRDDDTFIPLETRTAIANKAQADLFISIHANSSSDPTVRGVEVYYLNFTTSADALQVAARENSVSDQSIHQLSDLVRKIALQDKISESRAFAEDVDQSLYDGLESGNPDLRNRGVKKAPFVVLIGANMPSILAEISFLSNPQSDQDLHSPEYRQRIAESLYRGVARYVDSLNGVRLAQSAPSEAR